MNKKNLKYYKLEYFNWIKNIIIFFLYYLLKIIHKIQFKDQNSFGQ